MTEQTPPEGGPEATPLLSAFTAAMEARAALAGVNPAVNFEGPKLTPKLTVETACERAARYRRGRMPARCLSARGRGDRR